MQLVDVQPVGQNGTCVGLAAFNVWFHGLTGVHMVLYAITDWLGLVPVAVCLGFGAMGATQLVRRRSLFAVDPDLLLLGVYYVSRTAMSKWESGRGYPSIDSLREVSRFFSVTIDELISPDEVVSAA